MTDRSDRCPGSPRPDGRRPATVIEFCEVLLRGHEEQDLAALNYGVAMRRVRAGDTALYRFDPIQSGLDLFVSTRLGGISDAPYDTLNLGLRVGDDHESVLENRRRVFSVAGLPLERSAWCHQVHSDGVATIGEADAGRGAFDEDSIIAATDAMITATPRLTLCVTLADCVPVVIYDVAQRVVGLSHAGWGGTVARVSSSTVKRMKSEFGSEPASLVVYIGPSIGPAEYEVGQEVADQVRTAYGSGDFLEPVGNAKYLFDLWQANVEDLLSVGVLRHSITVAGISTFENAADFFSARRSRVTGRFITAVTLTGN